MKGIKMKTKIKVSKKQVISDESKAREEMIEIVQQMSYLRDEDWEDQFIMNEIGFDVSKIYSKYCMSYNFIREFKDVFKVFDHIGFYCRFSNDGAVDRYFYNEKQLKKAGFEHIRISCYE